MDDLKQSLGDGFVGSLRALFGSNHSNVLVLGEPRAERALADAIPTRDVGEGLAGEDCSHGLGA